MLVIFLQVGAVLGEVLFLSIDLGCVLLHGGTHIRKPNRCTFIVSLFVRLLLFLSDLVLLGLNVLESFSLLWLSKLIRQLAQVERWDLDCGNLAA